MKIEVLGTGCPRCHKLEAMAREIADRLDVACEVEHVQDIGTIIERGVMVPPGLAIDGKVVLSGRIPSETELIELITASGNV